MDQILREIRGKKRFTRIRETLKSFDSLNNEINEYNTTFWSKFLFVFWLTYGLLIVWLVFTVVLLSFPLLIRIIFIYATILFGAVYFFTIFTASSVNYSVNNSYKSLNSSFISFLSYSQNNKNFYYYRITTKMKVFFLNMYILI